MGWGRTLLLGDIGNRLDIADTERDVERLKSALRSKQGVDHSQNIEIAELRQENEQLKLYVSSLIRLLVSRGVVTAEEVSTFVNLIDVD
ncbi:MAG: hypothetical protein IT430_00980 [Phycisphaerales bacterium]|nr:hypothetical protein [Phycisphaerales bacterium]